MSTSFLARNLSRRVIERTLLTKVTPHMGAVRFTSYFTPGKFVDCCPEQCLVSQGAWRLLTLLLYL